MRRCQLKDHPVYFNEFDFKKNELKYLTLSENSSLKVYWICKNGHSWFSSPLNRNKGLDCRFCPKEKKVNYNSIKIVSHCCQNGHEWLEPDTIYNKRKTCLRCQYHIFDARTFLEKKYKNVLVLGFSKYSVLNKNKFHFYEDEVYYKFPIIKSILDNEKDKTIKINSVKLKAVTLSMDEGYIFEKENSLNSTARYAYCIALAESDEKCSIMQMIRYLPQKNGTVKILAISTKNGYNIAGGYSRLLRELDKKLSKDGRIFDKMQISINPRFNKTDYWVQNGYKIVKYTKPFCYTDGTLRASSKTLLKNAYKIYEPEHYLLEKQLI